MSALTAEARRNMDIAWKGQRRDLKILQSNPQSMDLGGNVELT